MISYGKDSLARAKRRLRGLRCRRICIGGVIVFIATIFVMRGRWSPAAARADEAAHDAAVARELHALQGS